MDSSYSYKDMKRLAKKLVEDDLVIDMFDRLDLEKYNRKEYYNKIDSFKSPKNIFF